MIKVGAFTVSEKSIKTSVIKTTQFKQTTKCTTGWANCCLPVVRNIYSIDTNAYKLQPSLSEGVIVDGHDCHIALHFGVKAKEIKTKFQRCTGYLNSTKTL